jgi:hypothetical protein
MTELSGSTVRAFVIWEPILSTDWSGPSTGVLARVFDRRAAQYWDREQLVAKQMATHRDQPEPDCCVRDGVLWDLAAVYARGARWTDRIPAAAFIDGPVVKIRDALKAAIVAAAASPGLPAAGASVSIRDQRH